MKYLYLKHIRDNKYTIGTLEEFRDKNVCITWHMHIADGILAILSRPVFHNHFNYLQGPLEGLISRRLGISVLEKLDRPRIQYLFN